LFVVGGWTDAEAGAGIVIDAGTGTDPGRGTGLGLAASAGKVGTGGNGLSGGGPDDGSMHEGTGFLGMVCWTLLSCLGIAEEV